MRVRVLGALEAAAAAAFAHSAGAQPAPPPFSTMRLKPDRQTEPVILRFRADAPRCGGVEVRPAAGEEPFPGALVMESPATPRAVGTVLVRFRIDSSGRPLGIAAEPLAGGFPLDVSDAAPALATWRFRAGAERRNCELLFRIAAEPVAAAAPETLYRFLALHAAARRYAPPVAITAAFDRIRPAGSNCAPRPDVRVQRYPPFDRIPQAPGTLSYGFMNYDIDAGGRARRVRLVSNSGNRTLARESLRAVAAFRFAPGARTGCTQYFFRRGDPLQAPPVPEEHAYRPADATCPKEERDWAHLPRLVFPVPFNRRGIEGWAFVRYDLGPDGETRNVEVADSSPAAEFGEQAAGIVRGARKRGDGRAYTGCTARVIFQLPQDGPPVPKGG